MALGQQALSRLFVDLNGRISRRSYWLGIGIVSCANLAIITTLSYAAGLTLDDYLYGAQSIIVVHLVALTLLFWPSMAVTIKRLHDRNTSGWWGALLHVFGVFVFMQAYFRKPFMVDVQPDLLNIVPTLVFLVLAAWLIVELMFLPGTSGENRFGPAPEHDVLAATQKAQPATA